MSDPWLTQLVVPSILIGGLPDGNDVAPVGGSLQLDSGAVPYASATVDLALTDATAFEPLDPRVDTRVYVSASNDGDWVPGAPEYTPWVETRRNLNSNPRMAGSKAYWASASATFPLTATPTGVQVDGIAASTHTAALYQGAYLATDVVGALFSSAMEVSVPLGYPAVTVELVSYSYTESKVLGTSGDVTVQPGETVLVVAHSNGTQVGATSTGVRTILYGENTPVGVRFVVRNAIVEKSAQSGPYFDGTTVDADLVRYSWAGPADASASVEETRTLTPPGPPSWTPAAPRLFNLGLRRRDVDHAAQLVTLELASDEAQLMDYAVLADDNGARAHEASARAVVNYVLAQIGASLAASSTDADLTAYWELTNLIPNPSVVTAVGTFYIAGAGTSAVDYSTAVGGAVGPSAVRWTAAGGVASQLSARQYTASEGRTYTATVYVRSGTTARSMRLRFNWRDSEGELLKANVGATLTCTTTDWSTRLVITAKAPVNTARVGLLVETVGAPPAGALMYADAFMLYDDVEVVPYFDGGTPSPGYGVAWEDAGAASQSTRTPVVERQPDMFIWRAGTSAWDFLLPLLTSVNLRLFCDEQRVWRLVKPESYAVPGNVVISPSNAIEGVDSISRDDPLVFATGVVVRYVWVDRKGVTRTRRDAAGTPEKVAVYEYAKPYPGAGSAAAILRRRNGTGRQQDVVGLAQWQAKPGMAASITLPDTDDQLGRVTSVDWSLGDDSTMRLGTSGLIDVPPGSWLATPTTERWTDPPALTWQEWT